MVGLASWEDIRRLNIPIEATAGLFVVESTYALFFGEGYRILPYAMVLAAPLLILRIVGYRMGGGDIKLAAALGPMLAASRVEVTFFIPFLITSLGIWGGFWYLQERLKTGRWPSCMPGAPAFLLALTWCGLKQFWF